jgi:hypothetical protein
MRSFARLVRDMRQAQHAYETGRMLDSRSVVVLWRQRDQAEAKVDGAVAEILGQGVSIDEEE